MPWTQLRYHLILGTKSRAPLITPSVEEVLYPTIIELIKEQGGFPIELGGVENHIHIAHALTPSIALSTFTKEVKRKSSLRLNRDMCLPQPFKWQVGFGAVTVSPGQMGRLRRYIRNQKQHHRHNTAITGWEFIP